MKTKNTVVVLTTSNENLYDQRFFEPIGPNDEILLEYTIFDAIEAGFEKIILIASNDVKNFIRQGINEKFKRFVEIHWVSIDPMSFFQLGHRIPYSLFSHNCYALWKAKKYINGPFLAVNGRFYHGKEIYREALGFMNSNKDEFAVINSPLSITLSNYGGVDRSICLTQGETDALRRLVEVKKVRRRNLFLEHQDKNPIELSEQMLATTGVYCLNNSFFGAYKAYLSSLTKGNSKRKITIPTLINFYLRQKMCKACLLYTSPSPRDGATSRMPSSA